jgi:hypothetical protein
MFPALTPLEAIRIANPCHVPWDAMAGDERVRYCDHCRLNVYNLAAMTREEAEDFLRRREGRTCLRLFRRADGAVLTRDCTGGARQSPRRVRLLLAGLLFTLLVAMTALWDGEHGTTKLGSRPDRWGSWRTHEPLRTVLNWLDPPPPPDIIEVGW